MSSYVDDNVFPKLLIIDSGAPATPAAGVIALYVDPADDHLKYKDDAGAVVDITAGLGGGGAVPLYTAYARLEDQKASGTASGSFTAGAWRQRTLNTIASDPSSIVSSLASNQFTLAAGTYHIRARAPVYQVDLHAIRLQNITDSTTTQQGMAAYASSGAAVQTVAELIATFTIAASKTFELDHQCTTSNSGSNGLGVAVGFTVDFERYAVVEIWKK